MTTAISMNPCSLSVALSLFELCKQESVSFSCEIRISGQTENFAAVSSETVKAEYVEVPGGPDAIVLDMGSTQFTFELNIQCSMYISPSQIEIAIDNEDFSAFFSSGRVTPSVIFKAHNLRDPEAD